MAAILAVVAVVAGDVRPVPVGLFLVHFLYRNSLWMFLTTVVEFVFATFLSIPEEEKGNDDGDETM